MSSPSKNWRERAMTRSASMSWRSWQWCSVTVLLLVIGVHRLGGGMRVTTSGGGSGGSTNRNLDISIALSTRRAEDPTTAHNNADAAHPATGNDVETSTDADANVETDSTAINTDADASSSPQPQQDNTEDSSTPIDANAPRASSDAAETSDVAAAAVDPSSSNNNNSNNDNDNNNNNNNASPPTQGNGPAAAAAAAAARGKAGKVFLRTATTPNDNNSSNSNNNNNNNNNNAASDPVAKKAPPLPKTPDKKVGDSAGAGASSTTTVQDAGAATEITAPTYAPVNIPDPPLHQVPDLRNYKCQEAGRSDFRGFLKGDEAPMPVILMSLGRSGSSATWQIIGNLTGLETSANEYTGSAMQRAEEFFDERQDDYKGHWITQFMMRSQRQYRRAGVVGFKWKPFGEVLYKPASICALKMLASTYGAKNIRLIRLRRNLLDVVLSISKHAQHDQSLKAHCHVHDEKCLEEHQSETIPVSMSKLREVLPAMTSNEEVVDQLLSELGVPHISVSYENLYQTQGLAHEWMRIFRFLGRGPTQNLHMDRVRSVMQTADTSVHSHSQAIRNYAKVKAVLEGTPYMHLLH